MHASYLRSPLVKYRAQRLTLGVGREPDQPSFDDSSQAIGEFAILRRLSIWRAVLVVAITASTAGASGPDFESAVAPILANRCLECHNPSEKAGGLDLSTRDGLAKGGDNGPVVEPGNPDESFLIQRVADGEMPPKKQGKPRALPPAELALLRKWVAEGGHWPPARKLDLFERTSESRAGRDWWSLQSVRRPDIPVVRAGARVANPVDSFVIAGLESRGWVLAPEADRRTLIRRAFVDVVGLPPSFEQVEAFVRDESPDAYERLVDRLLASPHFGERWGRFWLDVARYAETCGYERDQTLPHAWKYRDWVVRAINDDKPYDRFILEQLAGDELPDRSEDTVIATGFLRLGTWNDEPNDPQEYKYERLEDMVHATTTAFLATTVKCARCHDHKFDPIRQTDYYRTAAAFWPGFIEPGPRELLGGPDRKTLGYEVLGWTDRGREPAPMHLLKKGDPNRPGPVVDPGLLSMIPALDVPLASPPPESKTTLRRLKLARWIADPRNPLTARVWVNRLWQHHFGHGLVRSPDNFGFTGDRPTHPELLDWLAAELTDGGWRSKRLHKLLLMSHAYRQSAVHPKEQEYSRLDAGNRLWWRAERRRLDAESLRDALLAASGRLDLTRIGGPSFYPDIAAEALEGLSTKSKAWNPSPAQEQLRRGVYIFAKRGLLPPLMTTFDMPDTTLPCGQRDVTLVAPQALALLNNAFVHEQSAALAARISAVSSEPEGRVRNAWRSVLTREPRPSEVAEALAHLERQERGFARRGSQGTTITESDRNGDGAALRSRQDPELRALASLCHVLLNSNEFLYVD